MLFSAILPIALLLGTANGDKPNPWAKKAPEIVEKFQQDPKPATLEAAFDAVYKADNWKQGLMLAKRAQEEFSGNNNLRGRTVRALWRGGKLKEAEEEARKIPADTNEPVALSTLITLRMAHGDEAGALKAAGSLQKHKDLSAADLINIAAGLTRSAKGPELAALLEQAKKLADPEHGYPETYFEDLLEGNSEFYKAVGDEPLNQIAQPGSAEMPVMQLINLPGCSVMINGKGPFRMIVDTGGSTTLSLNQSLVEELGLKTMGESNVRGVSGSQSSTQHLVDELRIGSIVCKRVVTRGMEFAAPLNTIADGILGTGVFGDGRMSLDFAGAKIQVDKSSDKPAPGTAMEVRLLSDAKIVGGIVLEGKPAWSIFDTGADVVAISPLKLRELFPDQDFFEVRGAAGIGVGQGDNSPISLSGALNFEIAGRKFPKRAAVGLGVLDTSFSPILGAQTDFLAGMSMFREMRSMTIDFAKVKMWIDWLPPKE